MLFDNFKNIGLLAEENRQLISEFIEPILNSAEPLNDGLIDAIKDLNEKLLDA